MVLSLFCSFTILLVFFLRDIMPYCERVFLCLFIGIYRLNNLVLFANLFSLSVYLVAPG